MTPEERQEYMRKWKLAHKDKIAVYNATYYYKHRENLLDNQRKTYKANKDEINAARRERYHTDPEYREKVSKYNQSWRSKKRLEDNKGEIKMTREEVNRKAREKYATDAEYRERCKTKSREATAKLDDEGRKKRAEYMREYHKKHPEYLERKRENEKNRRERLKEQNNVQ